MILEILRGNLAPWVAQVFVIATAGALLPFLFRIRHPRTQLAYCHLVLIACAIFPLIQPWHHAFVAAGSLPAGTTAANDMASLSLSSAAAWTWQSAVLGILGLGFVVRLAWLGMGLLQIRQYRLASTPLDPAPESVMLAQMRTGAAAISGGAAEFRISPAVASPATVGLFRPVILLPDSFLQLPEAAQHGIACHELIHVRRNDWVVTVVEEVFAAAFWFHPGIWWLLAQTRLSREQLVDAEVVRLTAAREQYIAALLAIAGTRLQLDLAPAPLFLRRRHLTERMNSLLSEVSMSRLRLVSSYSAMAAILAVAAWAMFLTFPLEGQAQIVRSVGLQNPSPAAATDAIANAQMAAALSRVVAVTAQAAPPPPPEPPQGVVGGQRGGGGGNGNAPPPPPPPPPPGGGSNGPIRVGGDVASQHLVYKVNPSYPPDARQARIEGVVILQILIAKDGTVSDVKIITSSSPLLVPGVVEAVKQWMYTPTLLNGDPVEVITTVTVNFSLGQ